MRFKMKTLFVLLGIMLALLQGGALAADSGNAKPSKPKYKKVTGEVVSASATSIVIKGRTKGPLTLAITAETDMVGAKTAKPGDRAAVNYRVDKNGSTATRITVLAASAKAVSSQPAPAPEASAPKSN